MNIPVTVGLAVGVFALVWIANRNSHKYDFTPLVQAGYDPNDVARLENLYVAMQNAGLSDTQISFMLSQVLHETGLLTSSANYHLMDDFNNYAGIKGNSHYASGPNSSYAYYPTIDDFVTDFVRVLNIGTQPINATSLQDYNNRLVQNAYYTADPAAYLADMQRYYNLLIQI